MMNFFFFFRKQKKWSIQILRLIRAFKIEAWKCVGPIIDTMMHEIPPVSLTGPFCLLMADAVRCSFVRRPVTGACALLGVESLAQTIGFLRQRTLDHVILSLFDRYMSVCLSVFEHKRHQLATYWMNEYPTTWRYQWNLVKPSLE